MDPVFLENKLNRVDEMILDFNKDNSAKWMKNMSPWVTSDNNFKIAKFLLLEVANALNVKLLYSLPFIISISDLEQESKHLRTELNKRKDN